MSGYFFSRKNRLVYLYVMPAMLVMALIVLWPFVYNVVISFSDMKAP
jgi:ABC-type sugar transport system permease subunit